MLLKTSNFKYTKKKASRSSCTNIRYTDFKSKNCKKETRSSYIDIIEEEEIISVIIPNSQYPTPDQPNL